MAERSWIEITELAIAPIKSTGRSIATFRATLNHGLVVDGTIIKSETFDNLRVCFKGVFFADREAGVILKRELVNRILATHVINHCTD